MVRDYRRVDQAEYQELEGGDDVANDSMDEKYGLNTTQATDLEDYDMFTQVADTSAAQAREGKDIQGIPWNSMNITRADFRIKQECRPINKSGRYYEFFYGTRLVEPTFFHFQMWFDVQISTLTVRDHFMVAGGFQGELICKCLDKPGVSFCTRTTYEDNAITNSVEIYDSMSGGLNFVVSSTDFGVREYDMERFRLINHFCFPWPVNHTSVSPDRKLLVVVGDDRAGSLVDAHNGQSVASIVGYLDYSFASAWHHEGCIFATGNQDKTCRVWDVRNLSTPVAILKGNMGAVRSIRFSSDGQFLVAAKSADFVHIYCTKANYESEQEIDFFGEISGVSLSPDDESLYIGVSHRTYAS